ncbi:MAG: tRNA (adenosine(37)-N6)-dimethylallyltransferase MiaA [Ignavibacteriales bacterium]|nr:tRNA (adenosine(37)-N6)-dimethylallyltransferase MiaA [Ignavibacteriales bacterium]
MNRQRRLEEVIVIVGPTCSGKTKLSLLLSERLNAEIISADSRQVFKLLSVGTAKPSADQLEKTKHHFISELNPDSVFNASMFAEKAVLIIKILHSHKKIPIVVGGSGLYIKALIDGISESADTDNELREELLELRQKYGNDYLYNELKKIDKVSSEKMLPQNWKRVMRALEVFRLTGKPIWQHHISQSHFASFNFRQIGLMWDRKILYKNIETRVDSMLKEGLVDEVSSIIKLGYAKDSNSLNTVGYKEIIQYLDGEISIDRAIELIKRNTRRYAKRQMTWFNADKRIKWYDINSEIDLVNLADKIAKEINERKN